MKMSDEIIVRKPTEDELKIASTWSIWEKEESQFDWFYDNKETCLIISGLATVTTEDGDGVEFGAGDYVIFPKGLSCTWTISEKIKKHYRFG